MSKKSKKNKRSDEAEPAATTLTRKEFEEELYKLQVELTRLQAWAVAEGARVDRGVRGARHGRQGRRDQADHRALQPARVQARGAAGTLRPREEPALHPALHGPLPRRGGDHPVRPLLVQPRGRRAGDGLLHRRSVRALPQARACGRARAGQQRHLPAQVLPRRQPGRAAAPVRGADRAIRSSTGS